LQKAFQKVHCNGVKVFVLQAHELITVMIMCQLIFTEKCDSIFYVSSYQRLLYFSVFHSKRGHTHTQCTKRILTDLEITVKSWYSYLECKNVRDKCNFSKNK